MLNNFEKNQMLELLMYLGTRISSHFSDAFVADFEMGLNEWRVLAALVITRKSSIREVCKLSKVHKTTVSRSIALLEKKNLIRVERRLRFVTVEITPDGQRFHEAVNPAVCARQDEILGQLSPAEWPVLQQILDKIYPSIDLIDGRRLAPPDLTTPI